MLDIVALGEAMIEFNEEPDGRYRQGFGGDTSNAAIAAARLGARVRYITQVGQDRFGDLLLALWQREGVDTAFVGRHPSAPTGAYVVNHSPAGHAFSYLRTGSAASRITPADLPPSAVAGARFLHLSAISQAISVSAGATVGHAINLAKANGAEICYDTNLRLKLWSLDEARATIAATLPHTDILKTSLEDAQQLTGLESADSVAGYYLSAGPRLVVVTLGADGALAATLERRERIPALAIKAVDATGAGDCFAGALLARLAAGDDAFAAARFANAAAALATTGQGAVLPLPRFADVHALMAGQ